MLNLSIQRFLNNFSTLIKKYREEKKLTQTKVSIEVGVSLRTLQRLEAAASEPSLTQIYHLSNVLGFNPNEIFNFDSKLSEEQKILWSAYHQIEEVAKAAGIGVWSFDVKTQEAIWSDMTKMILEVPMDFIPTLENISQFSTDEKEHADLLNFLKNAATTTEGFSRENYLKTFKDKTICLKTTCIVEKFNDKPYKVYGIIQDITAHKNLTRKLKTSLARLEDIHQFVGLGRWEFDLKSNRFDWTDSIYNLLGYEVNSVEPSMENFMARVHPDDRALIEEKNQRSFSTGEPFNFEHRVVLPDGSIRWLLEKGKVIFDEDKRPIKSLGYSLDITQYKN